MRHVQIPYQGQLVDAVQLDFTPEQEPWTTCALEDGTRMRVKLSVTHVYRIIGVFNQDGEPLYYIRSSTMAAADVPPHLMRTQQEKTT